MHESVVSNDRKFFCGVITFSCCRIKSLHGFRIKERSSLEEIKEAYKKLSREFHPDKIQGKAEKFKEVQKAHEVLMAEKQLSEILKKYDEKYHKLLRNLNDEQYIQEKEVAWQEISDNFFRYGQQSKMYAKPLTEQLFQSISSVITEIDASKLPGHMQERLERLKKVFVVSQVFYSQLAKEDLSPGVQPMISSVISIALSDLQGIGEQVQKGYREVQDATNDLVNFEKRYFPILKLKSAEVESIRNAFIDTIFILLHKLSEEKTENSTQLFEKLIKIEKIFNRYQKVVKPEISNQYKNLTADVLVSFIQNIETDSTLWHKITDLQALYDNFKFLFDNERKSLVTIFLNKYLVLTQKLSLEFLQRPLVEWLRDTIQGNLGKITLEKDLKERYVKLLRDFQLLPLADALQDLFLDLRYLRTFVK